MDTPVAETTDGLGRRARIGQVKTEMLMQYNISLDLLGASFSWERRRRETPVEGTVPDREGNLGDGGVWKGTAFV